MKRGIVVMIALMGLIMFVRKRKHLLMRLMCIEFLGLVIFMGLMFIIIIGIVDGYMILYYLVMRACEGALGLRIIVIIVRGMGRDFIYGGGILQC